MVVVVVLLLSFLVLKGYKNVWGLTENFDNDPEVDIFCKGR